MKIETMKELFGEFIPAEMWENLDWFDEAKFSLTFNDEAKFNLIAGIKYSYVCVDLFEQEITFHDLTDASMGSKCLVKISYELMLGNATTVINPE